MTTPFESLILRVIGAGELTAHQIARAIDDEIPGALTGREGSVHPALIALERKGAIASAWQERQPGGRRRVYRLPALECLPELAP